MKNRIIAALLLILMSVAGHSVPARRGLWTSKSLQDGSRVTVRLCGDEHFHYWEDAAGIRYVSCGDDDVRVLSGSDQLRLQSLARDRRNRANAARRSRQATRASESYPTYEGEKKGLIILVEFADKKFNEGHDKAFYDRVANEPNFTTDDGFVGSVSDYFTAQSYGRFQLTFDIAGPVELEHGYAYYGENDSDGYDKRPGEMVAQACLGIANYVNFKDYDWDGDGEVDQVFVLYAGRGEADGGGKNTVWPHEFELLSSDYGYRLLMGSVYINTYACANEMAGIKVDGIGTICHEFSHCLGLPDIYDTVGSNYGMGSWSLMDYGCYNGNSFVPAGFTSYERMACGWLTPQELTADSNVSGMSALTDKAEAYLMRNDNCSTEYYLIENRQPKGWDAKLDGSGVLIIHVDYDEDVWWYNEVNSTGVNTETGNDHQRCAVVRSGTWRDTYPADALDSLTRWSTPASEVFNINSDYTYNLNKALKNISIADDGTASFSFYNEKAVAYSVGKELFYESFDDCNGSGGNDDLWSGRIATSNLNTDNTGWMIYKKGYGANKCARFGTAKLAGVVTTPPITINGTARISFRAGAWVSDAKDLKLSVPDGFTISTSDLKMKESEWTDYSADIIGTGTVTVTFTPGMRFFLDEVRVTDLTSKDDVPTDISTRTAGTVPSGLVYDLQGRRIDVSSVGRGIYVINGKKYVKQ